MTRLHVREAEYRSQYRLLVIFRGRRDELTDGPAMGGDDDSLTPLDFPQVRREVCFQLANGNL